MILFNQMVEYTSQLDNVFASLADNTRRDILERVYRMEMTVSDIASKYDMSLAAISKHLRILEDAQLITKRREGRKHMIRARTDALRDANEYLEQYRQMWQERFNKLDSLIQEEGNEPWQN